MATIVWKRALAFLIDSLIVSLLLVIVYFFIPYHDYSNELSKIVNQLLRDEISVQTYFIEMAEVYQTAQQADLGLGIINFVLVVIFFMIIPYFREKTIGQAINGIKIKSDKLTLWQLFIRAIVVNSILITIISLTTVNLLAPLPYIILIFVLSIAQIVIVIKSIFMILLNDDRRGLQDIWSNTEIVFEEEKNETGI